MEVSVTNRVIIKHLEALRKTVSEEQQDDFWRALGQFAVIADDRLHSKLTLLSWAVYFHICSLSW